ncbi:MAG: cellulase family glycosylhydrolase [Anaerolineae bacterium]|nr:cellulase family glycosylhydrolase [Anaerolineae bacterium]
MASPKPNPFVYFLESVVEGKLGGCLVNVLVLLMVGMVLLLPPISLGDRLMSIGYTRIGVQGGSIEEQGFEVNFLPEGVTRSFRVSLDVIPRSSFLEGSAGNSLINAAESIPPYLVMRSPYYEINQRGADPEAVLLVVPLPGEVEDINTLDLYAWNDDKWEWLPNTKIPTEDIIESQLDYLPESVVVMATHPINPNVSTNYTPGTDLPDNVRDTLVEINPRGLFLDNDGRVGGTLAELSPEVQNSSLLVIPTIRNWSDDGVIRTDLVDNMLIEEALMERHVESIVDLVERNAYQGIDIDYRAVSPELRGEFTTFIEKLGQALPENKILSVRVDPVRQISPNEWETGAYDWQAVGRTADVVKVPTFPDPRAYRQGGEMETMLNWAVGNIDRYKIQLILSTLSTEQVNGIQHNINYQDALAPIGNVAVVGDNVIFNPGQQLGFTLGGLSGSTGIQFDRDSGAYWYAYLDEQDVQRTVYLENAASISRKLQFVAKYNLRGVAMENLLNQSNDAQVWSVMDQFLDLVIPPVESKYSVVWRVQNEDGGVIAEDVVDLSSPGYSWTAPEGGGAYEVDASIASERDTSAAVPRGSVAILVATPTPVSTPTPLPSPTPEVEATEEPPPAPVVIAPPPPAEEEAPPPAEEPAPADTGVAAVAAAKGNLPFDYGIQADPRGNTTGNISLIKGMGFNWVKFQMPWKDVEGSPGDYGWGEWDSIINSYSSSGIKVLLSIPKAPDWARPPDDDKSVEGPPQDPNTYATFVGAVAGRYKGKVHAIEVWNEQNLYYEAGGQGRINPATYTELLKLSYNAIKSANPDMIVVTGAMTPTGAPPPAAMDDVEYLRQMYANGAKGFFDAVGAHPSGFANPPDALYQGGDFDPARGYDDHRSFFFRNTMEEYRRVMVDNGDGDKTIWPTEFGWPVWRFAGDARFTFAQQNSLEQQANFTVRAYQLGKEWGWVGTMFLWNLDYNMTASNTELANFGIVGSPTYDALAAMPK